MVCPKNFLGKQAVNMITECLLHSVLTGKSSYFLILAQNAKHLDQGLLQKLEGFMNATIK